MLGSSYFGPAYWGTSFFGGGEDGPPTEPEMIMWVTEEHFEGRSHRLDADFQRTYTRTFVTIVSDNRVGPASIRAWVLAEVGIGIGSTYVLGTPGTDLWAEYDDQAFLREVRVDLDGASDDGHQWRTTLDYGPWVPRESNPLDEPIQIVLDTEKRERILDVDADGDPVLNSAYDRFATPVMRDYDRVILTLTRNELAFDDALAAQYRNTVNEDDWVVRGRTFDAEKALCVSITYRNAYHAASGPYAVVTYRFAIDDDGHDATILDQGYREVVGGARRQILIEGMPATEPVLLNGSGVQLAPGGTHHTKTFKRYPRKDFTVFGFPTV